MASKFNNGLKRSALTIALGLCFAGSVQAQSSVGSLFGNTSANSTVRIENLDTGLSREITADSSGRFSFSQLQPGRYKVTSGESSKEASVRVGTGTSISFASADATTLDTVTVVGSGAVNPIDVSSVESTTVFTQEQIQALPVGRNVNEVALLAPGTVRGDSGLGAGNLASFGGASVAENGYYINGFDVTDLRRLLSYADLPFDAIGEQQIKTGGYGAEFGRSLGGVVSLVTKRGTNEWKGGVSMYWSPSSLRSDGKNVLSRDPDGAKYTMFAKDDTSDSLSMNIYGGGPIIKDRLFVFGLIETRNNTTDNYGQEFSTEERNRSPNGMLKLDWNITDNHIVELTGIYNKSKVKTKLYENAAEYSTSHDGTPTESVFESGGRVYIGKYTGYLTDNLTVSAQYGKVENLTGKTIGGDTAAALCPAVYDAPGLVYRGCWDVNHFTVLDPFAPDNEDTREAGRLDVEWVLGDHTLRGGYDTQKFTSTNAGLTYSGGVYWRYFNTTPGSVVNGAVIPAGVTQYARKRFYQTTTGTFDVINTAWYLEDSWQVSDNLMIYAGLRNETFDNRNAVGDTFVKADKLYAPRLGFSWDVNGDSSFKVFANAGRYFIPVANNTNIRASAAEEFWTEFYTFGGKDPVTGAPTGTLTQLGPRSTTTTGVTPDSRTIADQDLNPMFQDEFILGMQMVVGDGWTLGVRGISRKVGDGMDDYCSPYALVKWAQDKGHTNFDPHTAAPCVLVNPGRDVTIYVDTDSTGNYTEQTIEAKYFNLPVYNRKYHAVEFFWEKATDRWALQGSYTMSKSKGNVEGYVNSTIDQEDPGLTQEFDYSSFQDGTYGYLPNDRRHVLKMFGYYKLTDQFRIGANMSIQSGRPKSCQGFVPPTVPDFNPIPGFGGGAGSYNSASSFYCLRESDRLAELTPRGTLGRTPWTSRYDLSFAYTPDVFGNKLTLQADVFNVFNSQTVTEYNEQRDYSRATSNSTLPNTNKLNPNYGLPTSFQGPRSVRFTVRYEF